MRSTLTLFDSHCHLHDDSVRAEAAELIRRAEQAGVRRFMLAGVHPEGWRHEAELRRSFEGVMVAYGVHPQVVRDDDAMVDELERVLERERPQAIGEIGLDGSDAYASTLPKQEALFHRQLELAAKYDLPVLLHVLKAHARALEIVAQHRVRGVLHSCSASADEVKRWVQLGWHVSFAGAVANPGARRIRAAAAVVPADHLLVETDAPFQTPIALRPARNEPAFLVEIVRALAQIRGTSEADMAQLTSLNAERLFATHFQT